MQETSSHELQLRPLIESILFISSKPLSVKDIVKAIGKTKEASDEISSIIADLIAEYNTSERGIHLLEVEQKNGKRYQMITNPLCSEYIQSYNKQELTGELTKPSLETLTIIAYKGPITKPELEHIRGVNCSLILRNLLIRGLVEETVGKDTGDVYYNATNEFIKWLGLTTLRELPEYEELNAYTISIEDQDNEDKQS